MEMVKVDPKLFVTCRLCLEEMGMYQITPVVQNQIKYCFDIDVDQFDGLPQLICGQCETILSDYFTKKRIFVGRQNALKAKLQVRKEVESSLCPSPPHEAVTSSQQNDNEEHDPGRKTTSRAKKRKSRVISSSSSSSGRASRAGSASRGTSSSRAVSASRTESVGRPESVGQPESVGRAESASRAPSASRVSPASSTENLNTINKLPRQRKKHICTRRESWEAKYTKKYACKLCKRDLKFGAGIANHIKKHANLISKYKDIINRPCTVKLIKIDNKPNPTGCTNTVALSQNKIVGQQKENVYVFYTANDDDIEAKNTGCPESEVTYVGSDDDEIIGKSKHIKRQRLLSKSSTDTVVLNDGNKSPKSDGERDSKRAMSLSKKQGDAEIECINIDDSSNGSRLSDCLSVRDNDAGSAKFEDVEAIKTIIRACQNKYITKRQEMLKTDIKKAANKGHQLKRKFLSMGRKVINKQGFSCTGLLRFMENKNLDIKWEHMMSGNKETNYVRIMPRLKGKNELAPENLGWKKKPEIPADGSEGPEEILPKQIILPPTTYPNKPIPFEMSFSNSSKNKTTKNNSSSKSAPTSDAFQNVSSKNSSTDIPAPKIDDCLSMPVISDVSTSATITGISKLSAILNSNSDIHPSSTATIDKNIPPLEVSDTINETMLFQDSKLLNENPVANPKQLPKKSNVSDSKLHIHAMIEKAQQNQPESLYVDLDNDQQTDTVMHMPIITSTTSLAGSSTNDMNINTANKDNTEQNLTSTSETTNEVEKPAPRIKVKPFSELMSDRVLQNLGQSQSVPPNIWTTNASTVPTNSLGVIITQVTSGGVPVTGAQVTNSNTFQTTPQNNNRVSVIMDTVELPNTKTDSPIRYFKNLLQIHNIVLIESHELLPTNAICLIKFKLQYLRENNQPVTLCLSVHCVGNIFAILVRDPNELNYIGLHQLSANWQWEVLKVYIFKQDVINKMLQNAQKISQEVYDYTKRFLCLLKSINFKKDDDDNK